MRILLLYGGCSQHKYGQLFDGKPGWISHAALKYNNLMAEGFAQNHIETQCMSGLPLNRKLTGKRYIKSGDETQNGVRYHYFATFNFPVIRQCQLLIKAFLAVLTRRRDTAVVCDILSTATFIGGLLAGRLRGFPVIGAVTDVPGYRASSQGMDMLDKTNAFFLSHCSAYVLLTAAMNAVVNPGNHPYVVLEGHADTNMRLADNRLENKAYPKILMYAGSLRKIYGIKALTEAFLAVSHADWELHIYGDGDFKDELLAICARTNTIRYHGVMANRDIVQKELSASLLVNPRPTHEEYTRYSFPSKNLEYMASGTPLLTTRLPGMPREYNDYVYLFEDETPHGLQASLSDVFAKSTEELHQKGALAKEFVLAEKNNILQTQKILRMIEKAMER